MSPTNLTTTAPSAHPLGWIGIGRMGYPLVERLARAGADISGFNRTRAKAEPLTALGVKLVDHPAELASRDIVFTMVSTARDLHEVTCGPRGVLTAQRAPRILVDLSTVSEADSVTLRAAAAARGTQLLVVPVSGNDVVARAGKLGVMASGAREAFETVLPYLQCFGSSVTYIGEADTARTAKIGHNMLLGIVYQALAEITVLAEKRGVPRSVMMDVINRSVLGSTFTRYKTPVIANLDYTVTFTLELMRKDLELALAAGRESETVLPLTEAVHAMIQRTMHHRHPQDDYTSLLSQQAADSGLEIRTENVEVSDGL